MSALSGFDSYVGDEDAGMVRSERNTRMVCAADDAEAERALVFG